MNIDAGYALRAKLEPSPNDTWAAVISLCKKAMPTGFSKKSIKAGWASMLFFLVSQYLKVDLGTSAIFAKSRWLIV